MVSSTDGVVAGPGGVGWRFEDTYARLPATLHVAAAPARVREPRVAVLNHRLADELGLDLAALSPDAIAALFAGQKPPAGTRTIAQAYAGHQYGRFTLLGDGRAILLGEHRTPDGRLVDIQFKGSGRTRFSRGGDGLAALGPMLREYVISEAMAALGIPTTRSLAVVTTGESVYRDGVKRGAILTRVAASHLRVGTFEYAAALQDERDPPGARRLRDRAALPGTVRRPATSTSRSSAQSQTARRRSIARWQLVGFIHGVMNTDNMAISGETIDYGPLRVHERLRPEDGVQLDRPRRPLRLRQPAGNRPVEPRSARRGPAAADRPRPREGGRRRHGGARRVPRRIRAILARRHAEQARAPDGRGRGPELAQALLDWMQKSRADFTNTFLDLSTADPPGGGCYRDPDFRAWYARWQERLGQEGSSKPAAVNRMRTANPAVIPRNHRVEEALAAAEERDDISPLRRASGGLGVPVRADRRLGEVPGSAGRRVRLPHLLRDVAVRHRGGYHLPRSVLPPTGSDSWRRRVAAADR